MAERRKSSIAKIFHMPSRLRKGSAISDSDVNAANACGSLAPKSLCVGLPAEIQILIIQYCGIEGIITLRCVSRNYCNLVTLHGAALFRHFTQEDDDLAQILSMYRCAVPRELKPSLYELCGLRHRTVIADKFAQFLVTHRMCEKARIQPFILLQDPQKIVTLRIASIRLRPYFFVLYHYFEALRGSFAYTSSRQVEFPDKHPGGPNVRSLGAWILDHYTLETKRIVVKLWEQIMRVVYRKTRPATYATKVERTFRGWNHSPASDNQIMSLLLLGGLEALYRVINVRGFSQRMKTFDKMLLDLQEPPEDSPGDDLRRSFGVMPPLKSSVATRLVGRLPDTGNFTIMGYAASTALTQDEQDMIRQSDLGTLAPLAQQCEEQQESQLVDHQNDSEQKSLQKWLKEEHECHVKPPSRTSPEEAVMAMYDHGQTFVSMLRI